MGTDDSKLFRGALEAAIVEFGLPPLGEKEAVQIERHYSMLLHWNARMNLTRIVGPEAAARMHYAECLLSARFLDGARSVLDIGSGAGFPSIPLAVLRPDLKFTALDANQKKALFLKEAKDELRLENFAVATARVEQFDCTGFDLLTSRALDDAGKILPAVIKRLASNQRFMLFSTPEGLESIAGLAGGGIDIATHPLPRTNRLFIPISSRH